jgi:hypothetical protein
MGRFHRSRLVTRYRFRLLCLRLRYSRPSTLDLVNLGLAVIGAWSVIAGLTHLVPASGLMLTSAVTALAVAGLACFYWISLTRNPQDLFRLASRTQERTQELRGWMAAGMKNEAAFAALESLYTPVFEALQGHPATRGVEWPVDADGRRALVLTIPAGPGQALDSLLVPEPTPRSGAWSARVGEFAAERQMFMATLRRTSSGANPFGDEQGENLVLDSLELRDPGDRLRMSVSTARYGQIVRTSDSLINEFALFGYVSAHSSLWRRQVPLSFQGDTVLEVLPWRSAVHAWDPGTGLLLHPRGRASGLGVAVVLITTQADGTTALMARRSANVGTYPDVLHVIPAGMINTRAGVLGRRDVSLLPRLTMLAEFLEECFDVAELSGHSVGNVAKRVEQELAERNLAHLEPEFLGVAVDLLNLRTEICGLLDLSSRPETLDDFLISWEYTHTEPLRQVDILLGAGNGERRDSVQSGLGALHLAARRYTVTSP